MSLAEIFILEKVDVLEENEAPNIFTSAFSGDLEALDVALKHWDVNAQDENKMTALHRASAQLRYEAVDRLLEEEGIDPTIVDKFGRSAAWMAIEVFGEDVGKKMHDKLAPYCYPMHEEDRDLYENDAPINEELDM